MSAEDFAARAAICSNRLRTSCTLSVDGGRFSGGIGSCPSPLSSLFRASAPALSDVWTSDSDLSARSVAGKISLGCCSNDSRGSSSPRDKLADCDSNSGIEARSPLRILDGGKVLRWRAKAAGEMLASIAGSSEPSRNVAGATSNLRLFVWVGNRESVAGKEFLWDGLVSSHGTPYAVINAMGPMKSSAKTWGDVVSSFITCKVTWNLTWRARVCLRFKSFSSAPACWDACKPVHKYLEPFDDGILHLPADSGRRSV